MNRPKMTVAWFSAGVSSAVATKLVVDKLDKIFYVDIEDQHEDTMRFVRECEQWFGKKIEIMKSRVANVENALCFYPGRCGFGRFAPCTDLLKRRPRREWESEHKDYDLSYVWGMDSTEKKRARALFEAMPKQSHLFPLIQKRITKEKAHQILSASGIKRPAMYDLGYGNNNCVGCIKGGQSYWNKIRVDFPDVFKSRSELEKKIGGSFLRKGKKKVPLYLDDLDPEAGRHQPIIMDDCGIMCEMMSLNDR
jgi:3'-phosphoadenosine 5'-phosphosulfate sulfotransferase (PAPS reductase)/FAD synthetase